MVFFEALSLAKTKLLWPVNDFEIRVNNHEYGKVMADLAVMQASDIVTLQDKDYFRITGLLPLETSLNYEKKFISDTSGFGIFLTKFHGYLDAPTEIEKKRACNMISPLDRGNYLLSHLGTVNR
jgi:translation elongation factor EF-G